jgi:hypothetical protein
MIRIIPGPIGEYANLEHFRQYKLEMKIAAPSELSIEIGHYILESQRVASGLFGSPLYMQFPVKRG